MDLRAVLELVTVELRGAGIEHALIGGLALAAHGAARATEDLDFLIDRDRADELDEIMRRLGYRPLYRTAEVANYVSDDAAKGRVDFLYAHRQYAVAMLARARPHPMLGVSDLRVLDAADQIGLKVQSSSNQPRRRPQDMADILRLLERGGEIDISRVREYFRLYDREAELDDLLASLRDA
jgi:hypothetical protein